MYVFFHSLFCLIELKTIVQIKRAGAQPVITSSPPPPPIYALFNVSSHKHVLVIWMVKVMEQNINVCVTLTLLFISGESWEKFERSISRAELKEKCLTLEVRKNS